MMDDAEGSQVVRHGMWHMGNAFGEDHLVLKESLPTASSVP